MSDPAPRTETAPGNAATPPSGGTPSGGAPAGRLGTFSGVFTPSILTILGIILFLRLGYVVGDGGLLRALVVIAIANAISLLTSFSLAAIATNFRVRGGGDYYLISRTLGPEFGGAIGLVLFLAQSVSVAFYAIGFSEGVVALFALELDPRWVAGTALLPLFLLSWLGADWASRFQFAIMAVLVLAIGSFVVGAIGSFDPATLADNRAPAGTMSFWMLFALFFPAVTGFTQGVSMSGDLRDPARSLPLGTFLAVGISIAVYLGLAILLAGSLPGDELIADYGAMRQVAAIPWLISAGLFAATLSSALASFLGAPRILQALSADKLFRFLRPFAHTTESGNPRRAVMLAFAIAVVTVILGDLNLVAPVVSMFFLISYGLLNYATYVEASARSPSFRPTFRWYHARVSLLGCLGCGAAMLAIDPTAGAIALAVLVAIHQTLRRTVGPDRWADSSRSVHFQEVRRSLLSMRETVEHDRDWRPVSLAISDDPDRRARIIRFASWIEGGSGLTTAVRLLPGEGPVARAKGKELEDRIREEIRAADLEAFARVVVAPETLDGFRLLFQASGVGPIRPNLALFHWFDQEGIAEDAPPLPAHGALVRSALRHGLSVVVLAARAAEIERFSVEDDEPEGRRIDVWWHGDASSRLALLLAYLMTRRSPWNGARIRLLAPRDGNGEEEQRSELVRMLEEVRIAAEPVLVADLTWDTMRRNSHDRTLAFVPLRIRGGADDEALLCDAAGEPVPETLAGLPPLALVQAAADVGLETQPDEGPQADEARAQDELEEAERRARRLREEADERHRELAALREERAAAPSEETPEEAAGGMARLAELEAKAAEADRRAAKAEGKAALLRPKDEASAPGVEGEDAHAEGDSDRSSD